MASFWDYLTHAFSVITILLGLICFGVAFFWWMLTLVFASDDTPLWDHLYGAAALIIVGLLDERYFQAPTQSHLSRSVASPFFPYEAALILALTAYYAMRRGQLKKKGSIY